ncbi:hypothetical protein [Streptosporangium roseum]|uniref:hypothetical protein n=1 Tax=Streptosporangium roseum TaxID=2001 RepID=UPI00331A91BE
MRADGRPPVRQRVDVPGALVVTAATALLIYGLVNAGDAGWGAAGTFLPLIASVIFYAVFVAVERGVKAP